MNYAKSDGEVESTLNKTIEEMNKLKFPEVFELVQKKWQHNLNKMNSL